MCGKSKKVEKKILPHKWQRTFWKVGKMQRRIIANFFASLQRGII
jgi:hypothetical protein